MTALLRVIWKEYRMLRGFWLALAICGVLIQLLLIELDRTAGRISALISCAVVFTYCFALGAAATLFAVEKEEGTHGYLQILPLRSSQLVWGKLLLLFAATALMAFALGSLAIAGGPMPAQLAPDDALGILFWSAATLIALLHMVAWGLFFSLRSARPLLAAVAGIAATVATMFALAYTTDWLLAAVLRKRVRGGEWFVSVVIATAAIGYIDVQIGRRWLLSRRIARTVARYERQPLLRRLLWQELRQSYRLLAAFAGLLFLAFGVFVPRLLLRLPAEVFHVVIVQAMLSSLAFALFGACAFLSDQERSQFRFFSDRGIAARRVWLGRQVFWGGIALLTAVLLLVEQHVLAAVLIPRELIDVTIDTAALDRLKVPLSWFGLEMDRSYSWQIQWESGIAGYFVWVSLAFGAGQLCSMFFRSGILAAVFGVLLAGALVGWAALMHLLEIGWWWSVAPLAVALFAATWLRAAGWMAERRSVCAWLAPVAMVLVPMLAIPAAVPWYRVWEIPESTVELAALPWRSETDQDAASLVKALDQLRPRAIELRTLSDPGNAAPTTAEWQWLEANETTLNVAIRASLRLRSDVCLLEVPGRDATHWSEIAAMLLRYGQLAERDGKLELAWERYRAVLKLSGSIRRRSSSTGENLGGEMQRAALAQLIRFSGLRGQTEKQLDVARVELASLARQDASLADVARRDYQEIHEMNPATELVAKWAPWELTRARRLLRYAMGACLLEAQDADIALAGRGKPVAVGYSLRPELWHAKQLWQTSLLAAIGPPVEIIDDRRQTVASRRATQLVLAAQAWRLDKGDLPQALAELEKRYFDKPVIDPFTNQPFEWLRWGLKGVVRSDNVARVAGGTPLLHSSADYGSRSEYVSSVIERLRRHGPNDPRVKLAEQFAGGVGLAGGGMAAGVAPAMPMMAAPPTAGSGGLVPQPVPGLVVDESVEYLPGLIFPIFGAVSDEASTPRN